MWGGYSSAAKWIPHPFCLLWSGSACMKSSEQRPCKGLLMELQTWEDVGFGTSQVSGRKGNGLAILLVSVSLSHSD